MVDTNFIEVFFKVLIYCERGRNCSLSCGDSLEQFVVDIGPVKASLKSFKLCLLYYHLQLPWIQSAYNRGSRMAAIPKELVEARFSQS